MPEMPLQPQPDDRQRDDHEPTEPNDRRPSTEMSGEALTDPSPAAPLQPALGTWEAIDSLRVVRSFAPRPLGPWAERRILDAGRRAGSSKNLQRWAFIACRDREHLAALATLGPWAGHVAGAALAVALASPDPRAPEATLSIMWDLGRAAQNMVLAAWELGIGSVPATVYEHQRAAELLGLPPGWHCEFILSFGYPADETVLTSPNRPGGRMRFAEVVHEERW